MNERYRFSRQEEKVLLLSISGLDDKAIAEQIGVGLGTVRTFWKRIRAKSGGGTRAEVMAAFRGLAAPDDGSADQGFRLVAEVAKREDAEARFAAVLESVSNPVLVFDKDGFCTTSNAPARDITGYTQTELAVTALSDLYAEEGGRLCRKDGTVATVEGHLSQTPSGGSVLVIVTKQQGVDTSLLEQAIRRARIGQIVVVVSTGVIVFANDRVTDLLANPIEETLGRRIHDLVAASDRTRLEQTLQRSMSNGEAQCSLNMLHRNGSFVSMFVDVAYMTPLDGVAHQVLTIRRMADAGRLLTARNSRIG